MDHILKPDNRFIANPGKQDMRLEVGKTIDGQTSIQVGDKMALLRPDQARSMAQAILLTQGIKIEFALQTGNAVKI